MKVFLVAAVFAGLIAAGAAFVLDSRFQETSEARFTTGGARLDPSI